MLAADILVFTKARLKQSSSPEHLQIQGFRNDFADCSLNVHPSHVAVYFKPHAGFMFKTSVRCVRESNFTVKYDIFAVSDLSDCLHLISICKSPGFGSLTHFFQVLEDTLILFDRMRLTKKSPLIISRNFNVNLLQSSNTSRQECSFFLARSLRQCVEYHTTIYGSLLDHVWTNLQPSQLSVSMQEAFWSDCVPVLLSLTLEVVLALSRMKVAAPRGYLRVGRPRMTADAALTGAGRFLDLQGWLLCSYVACSARPVLTLDVWRCRQTAGNVNMLEPCLAFHRYIVCLFDGSFEVLTVHVRNVSQRSNAVDGLSMIGRRMLEQILLTFLTPSTAIRNCSVMKVSFLHRSSAHSFSLLLVTFLTRLLAGSNLASLLYPSYLSCHGNTGDKLNGRDFPSSHDSPQEPARNHSQSHAGHEYHVAQIQD
jgi:hypothetical protein